MFAPKNILVPTDFSKYADKALKQSIDIAKKYKAKIYLLHVIDDGFQQCSVDYCLEESTVRGVYADSIKMAKEKLAKEVKRIVSDHKDIEIVSNTIRGIPYAEILKAQKEKKIDLIVIASHGKTSLLKKIGIMIGIMGSVADKVVKGAKCAVIVIKP
jgi:nucleotide-binding universal stress UspA family protein